MTADGDAQVCASVVSVAMCYSILPVFDQWRRSQQKLKSFYGYYTKSAALCLRMEVDPTEILAFRYTLSSCLIISYFTDLAPATRRSRNGNNIRLCKSLNQRPK